MLDIDLLLNYFSGIHSNQIMCLEDKVYLIKNQTNIFLFISTLCNFQMEFLEECAKRKLVNNIQGQISYGAKNSPYFANYI